MNRFLVGAACLTLLVAPVSAAQDIEVVANSILQTYADYCEPLYVDQHRPQGGEIDYDLVQSYGRVLLVRYAGDCKRFFVDEVAAATVLPDLIARLPALGQPRPRTLTDTQAILLGMLLRYSDLTQTECAGAPDGNTGIARVREVADPWSHLLGRDEAFNFAQGYVGAEQFARIATGIPPGDAYDQCGLREGAAGLIGMTAVNSGLVSPEALRSNEAEPDSLAPAQIPESANTSPDAPNNGYIWEPGDPGTDRGNGDQPIDLTPYVDPTDVAAIKSFTGVWGSAASCDEGHTYLIGQFDWKDGQPQLGRGVPRISTEHLACEAGQWSVTGDISTFSALCHPDGEGAWSGTGTIRWVSEDAIQLFLLDDPEPVRLERCSNQPFDVRDASSADDPQAPMDLFGN